MVVLKGNIVTLRKHRMSDLEELYKNLNDYEVAKWFQMFEWPMTRKKVRDFLKSAIALNREKKPTAMRFAIVLNSTKKVIGCINLHNIKYDAKSGETGTWIGSKYWGKGINQEAKELLIGYWFNKMKFNKVVLNCVDVNENSKRAIEKLGAKREGILREHRILEGKYHDLYTHSILKNEWKCR